MLDRINDNHFAVVSDSKGNEEKILISPSLDSNTQDSFIVHLGYFGSYLSGLTSIFILTATLVAVYFSYQGFQEEKRRAKEQRFEDHFFHLLQIHRENVRNIEIDTISGEKIQGVKAILLMFRELMLISDVIINKHDKQFKKSNFINLFNSNLFFYERLEKQYLIEISFYIFFIGAGKRSQRTLRYYLDSRFGHKINVEKILNFISDNNMRERIRKNEKFPYKLFGGHQTRLGHYYRHLYHTIKMIDTCHASQMSDEVYKDYVRKLRIQLNTYEQALLVINSCSVFGAGWQEYILKYKLVKNLPKNFYDSKNELNIEQFIMDISETYHIPFDTYFEYEEQEIQRC